MRELDSEYTVDFGLSEKGSWAEIMSHFKDANIYQTWPYDIVRFGKKRVTHMVLRKNDTIVAAAQLRISKLPLIKSGIAYALWGPMWRLSNMEEDEEVFRQTIRALRNELSVRRGLAIRLYPYTFKGQDDILVKILKEEGYERIDKDRNKMTLLLPLNLSLEELRSNLKQKWRNCLNRAEKNDLELIEGEEDGMFDEIAPIYMEMVRRKDLDDINDINHLKKVQKDLPPEQKLKVILCKQNGELCFGGIFSTIGNSGIYLIGATSLIGLKTNSSYMVQWAFIKWLKEKGYRFYDLNGINKKTNPGVYRFKMGLAGKIRREVEHLGKYQVADSWLSAKIIYYGELMLNFYKKLKYKTPGGQQ